MRRFARRKNTDETRSIAAPSPRCAKSTRRSFFERRKVTRIDSPRADCPVTGLTVFTSMGEALRCGYQICGRTTDGYLVRIRSARGWSLGIVVVGGSTPIVRPYEPPR